MSRPWTPADTDLATVRRQVERWRSMTPGERAQEANELSIDVSQMAIAGIRAQDPDATPHELRRELARRRYGDELVDGQPIGL